MPKADDTIVLLLSGKAKTLLIGGIDAAKKLTYKGKPYIFTS
jgi:hypothetical protein